MCVFIRRWRWLSDAPYALFFGLSINDAIFENLNTFVSTILHTYEMVTDVHMNKNKLIKHFNELKCYEGLSFSFELLQQTGDFYMITDTTNIEYYSSIFCYFLTTNGQHARSQYCPPYEHV